ncbi:hypothetical protein O1L44_30135 [Streptomyces noursei]|nr:hypothetical protein [Streptomyces noursei]
MQGNSRAVRVFTRDAGGQLRDLEGRFVSVAHASRLIQDSNGRWRDLNGRFIASTTAAQRMAAVTAGLPPALRTVTNATTVVNGRLRDAQGRFLGVGEAAGSVGDAAQSAGGKFGGLGGALGAVAAVAGMSLLPALGALAPMLAGAGLAAGTLKLGFSGVGDALQAAAQGKKEYQKALRSSPRGTFLHQGTRGDEEEFADVGRDVQKAMLPGFTKALKAADPVVKIVGRGMTELGGAFGKAAEGAGRLFKDSGFQKDLEANLTLGRQFVGDMMSGLGGLGRGSCPSVRRRSRP